MRIATEAQRARRRKSTGLKTRRYIGLVIRDSWKNGRRLGQGLGPPPKAVPIRGEYGRGDGEKNGEGER